MLSRYKNYFEETLQPVAKSLRFLNPNFLTLIGIIPQALFFYLMRGHNYGWAMVALAFSFIDMLDGMIARLNHQVSAFGGLLDSVFDRIADFLIIWAFYVAGLINLELALVLVVSSFLVSYIRSRGSLASGGQLKFEAGWIERPERIIFLFFVIILQIAFPTAHIGSRSLTSSLIYVLTVLTIFTFFQRLWYAYKKL